jgi:cytochrome c oxidase subunit II
MNESASIFMPPTGTAIADQVNNLYSFLLWVSFISCAILIGGMVFFVLKYKRKTNKDKTAYITHNHFLEFLWSFIPLVIFLFVFAWGWRIYHEMRAMPANAFEVNVFGRQWAWDFLYKSGKQTTNEFVVPAGEPVKLVLTSKDVIHSFYIPSMRLKQDAVPGRYTALWFTAEKTGNYHVFCTEYCGAAHSSMLATMKVVPRAEFDQWLQQNDEGLSLAEKGKKLFNEKGCVACHSVDGTIKVGPSLKGVVGRKVEWEGGTSGIADENYIQESVMTPNAKVVKGFPAGTMPTFQGQISEVQLAALIEYFKSLE